MDTHGEHRSSLDEHRWVNLGDPADVPGGVIAAVRAFVPLSHDAGAAAKHWLDGSLAGLSEPLDTWLCLSQDDFLLGFVSLTQAAFTLSERDRRILEFRRTGRMTPDPQRGTMITWIARDHSTARGSGRKLFRLALARAILSDSAALIVEPHDAAAGDMWIDDYCFREFAPPTGKLWFPVGNAPQGYP